MDFQEDISVRLNLSLKVIFYLSSTILFVLLSIKFSGWFFTFTFVGLFLFSIFTILLLSSLRTSNLLFFFVVTIPVWNFNVFGRYTSGILVFILTCSLICLLFDKRRLNYLITSPFLLLLLFFVTMICSMAFANDIENSQNVIIAFAANMLLPYGLLIIMYSKAKLLVKAFKIWVFIAVFDAILSIFQYIIGTRFFILQSLFSKFWALQPGEVIGFSGLGLFATRYQNAFFLCSAFIISLVFFFQSSKHKFLFLIPLIIIVFGIFTTMSRTFFILLLLSFVVTIVLINYMYQNNLLKFVVSSQMLILVIILAAFIFTYSKQKLPFYRGLSYRLSHQLINSDLLWRFNNWKESLKIIESRNIFFGVGIGSTGGKSIYGVEVHNSYIEIFVETGLLGLVFWLIFIVYCIKRNLDNIKKAIITKQYIDITIIVSILPLFTILGSFIGGQSFRIGDPFLIIPFALIEVLHHLFSQEDNQSKKIGVF